jgi:hypothetical protein
MHHFLFVANLGLRPNLEKTSVCPVHNAQVCYFNNVWFMFLVFKKNIYLFKQPLVPPCFGPSHFPLRFFTPSTPPPLCPSHFPLRFFNPSSPSPSPSGPSHFPLRLFTRSIPPPSSHFPLRFKTLTSNPYLFMHFLNTVLFMRLPGME